MTSPIERRRQIQAARTGYQAARDYLESLVEKLHPVGSELTWEKPSGQRQHGTVLTTGGREGSMRVRNEKTGAEYWIDLYNVYGMTP